MKPAEKRAAIISALLVEQPAKTEINPRTGIPELFLARVPRLMHRHGDSGGPGQADRQKPAGE